MSADELRRAATTLRGRARVATPGPWRVADRFGMDSDRAYVLPTAPDDHSYVSAGGAPELDMDAAYIATMHPGVGLALADWLDDEFAHDFGPSEHAITLARLINGGAS